jgi:hypothetical protein
MIQNHYISAIAIREYAVDGGFAKAQKREM